MLVAVLGRGYVMFPLRGWTSVIQCRTWDEGGTSVHIRNLLLLIAPVSVAVCLIVNADIHATAVAKST